MPYVGMPVAWALGGFDHFGLRLVEIFGSGLMLLSVIGVICAWLSPFTPDLFGPDKSNIVRQGRRVRQDADDILYAGFDERERLAVMRAQGIAYLFISLLVVFGFAYVSYAKRLGWWYPSGREDVIRLMILAGMALPTLPAVIAELSIPPPVPEERS